MRPRAAVGTTALAIVIAGLIAVGLWAALTGVHHPAPATRSPSATVRATPTPDPSPPEPPPVTRGVDHRYSATVSPKPCTSGQIQIADSSAGGAGLGTWYLPILLRNTGADCLLAAETTRVVIDGRPIRVANRAAPRGAIIPADSFASLVVRAPTACEHGDAANTTTDVMEAVTLRIGGSDRRLPDRFPRTRCVGATADVSGGIAFASRPSLDPAYRHLTISVRAPLRISAGALVYTVAVENPTDRVVTLEGCLAGTQALTGLDSPGSYELTVTQTVTRQCTGNDRIEAQSSRTITLRTTVPAGRAWTLAWTLEHGPTASAE